MEKDKRHIKDALIGVIAVVLFYGCLQLVGITCPIKFLTGISCVGCGMTRAWLSLILRGDLVMAYHYHPLFWLVIPAGILIICKKKVNQKLYKILLGIIIAVAVGVYLYRMFSPADQIVVFEPGQSIIVRAGKILYRLTKGVV